MEGNPNPVWKIYNVDTMESPFSATIAGSVTVGPIIARCESAGYWACSGKNSLNRHGGVSQGFNLTVYCKFTFREISFSLDTHLNIEYVNELIKIAGGY